MKKVLCVLLSAGMLLTCVPAFAAGTAEEEAAPVIVSEELAGTEVPTDEVTEEDLQEELILAEPEAPDAAAPEEALPEEPVVIAGEVTEEAEEAVVNAGEPTSVVIYVVKSNGQEIQLGATVYPTNPSNQQVTWTSSDNDIVTVSSAGLVRISSKQKFGKATITATAWNGRKATYDVEVLDAVAAFVQRLYTNVLGRDYDVAGLNNWVKLLKNGSRSGASVAMGFFLSKELENQNISDTEYVSRLYTTLLGRVGSDSEIQSWVSKMDAGVTRKYLLAGFINSTEFDNLCKSYNIKRGTYKSDDVRDQNYQVTAFVTRLYKNCFGRKPDEGGLKNWVTLLLNKSRGGGGVARGFFNSDEMQQRGYTNSKFITVAYNTLLNRAPDAAGRADWLNRLNTGTPRSAIVEGFIGSVEFANLCSSYGIKK